MTWNRYATIDVYHLLLIYHIDPLTAPTVKVQAKPKDTRAPFKSDDVNRTNKVRARYVLHYHRLQSRKRITCCLGLSLLGWMTPLMRSRRVNGCLRGLCTLKAPVSVIRLTDYTWKTQICVYTQPGRDSMTLPVVIVCIETA